MTPNEDALSIELRTLRFENAYLKGQIRAYEKFLVSNGFMKQEDATYEPILREPEQKDGDGIQGTQESL